MFLRYGMNALQYGHQVAQNTTTVGLPAATAGNSTARPSKSVARKVGAVSPFSTANAACNGNAAASAATMIAVARRLIRPPDPFPRSQDDTRDTGVRAT